MILLARFAKVRSSDTAAFASNTVVSDATVIDTTVSNVIGTDYTASAGIPHASSYQSIQPAIEYISSNLDDKEGISEPSLAALCHMGVSNLRRLFKLCTGLSPKAYIIRSRIAYAEYLLRKTDLSVLEISIRTGYGELSGFNRLFVQHFGVFPGKYRRKYK